MSPSEHTRRDAPVACGSCDEKPKNPNDQPPAGSAAHAHGVAASLLEGNAVENPMGPPRAADEHHLQEIFNLYTQTQILSPSLAPLRVKSNSDILANCTQQQYQNPYGPWSCASKRLRRHHVRTREQRARRAPEHISPPPSGAAACAGGNKAGFEEFFTIRPSKLGGLGAFATRDLRRGETILTERPLLRTTHFRLMLDYYNLSDAAKKTYLSLHGGEDGDRFGRVERVKVLNSFQVPGGVAIFEIASRFNHACPPARNVRYAFDDESGLLSLTVCHDVAPAGAELLISYGGLPAELYSTYGFRCRCGGCTPLTDDDIRTLRCRQFGAGDCSDEYDASEW
ncbi:hypothetical protein L209DRAFT_766982 [Thermothelomyces heterothallicus CBS 203.75]